MSIEPKPGMIIRFDYLWNHEKQQGQEHGSKNRSTTIVLTSNEHADGSKTVFLAPIPPSRDQSAVKIPLKVSKHLGLDGQQSWIVS